ncbi:glycoside hydrolase family 19 protein [Nocardia sp. NPDC051570]|uniref:glycoside hydrolase family 19 protein n=1 Tax=Nocardia sp. NPDC051570 TaxID=3364324 RepID=UPI0037BBFE59
MTPPRSVLTSWRAAAAAERLRAEFDRHIEDVADLSAVVYEHCRRLDGDGWQGAAYDAVLAHVEAAHRHNRLLCERGEALRDAGARALSDLNYTALALLDYVADAEDDGCVVADDWTVTADPPDLAASWGEVIAEAAAAVARADASGRRAIRAALGEMLHPATLLTFPELPIEPLGDSDPGDRMPTSGPSDSSRGEIGLPISEQALALDVSEVETAAPGSGRDTRGLPISERVLTFGVLEAEPVVPGPDGSAWDTRDLPTSGQMLAPGVRSAEFESDEEVCAAGDSTTVASADLGRVPGADDRGTATMVLDTIGAGTSAAGSTCAAGRYRIGPVDGGVAETWCTSGEMATRAQSWPPASGITAEQLVAIMPDLPLEQARKYVPALNAAMGEGEISTPLRQAVFLAQLAHESGELRYFEELGDHEYFRQYDPDGSAPAAGNTEPGDGPRYHGRGPIQLTGRANYRAAGAALGLDLEGDPGLAADPAIGFRIAQWYWTSRDLNALADTGDLAAVTRAVNGCYHGLAAREVYYRRALAVLA